MEDITMDIKKNMKNIKEECDICGEYMNKSNRKKVTCPYETCGQSCCRMCFYRFVNDSGVTPVCMWCKKDFSLDFIYEHVTQKFYNEYMEIRTNVYLERSMSQVHLLQDQANEIIRARKLDRLIRDSDTDHRHLVNSIQNIFIRLNNYHIDIFGVKKAHYERNIRDLSIQKWDIFLNNIDTSCSICHTYSFFIYDKCNIKVCDNCIRLYALLDYRKCILCGDEEISKDLLHDRCPKSYYNKYICTEKYKIGQEFKDEIKELIRKKFALSEKLISLYYKFYTTKHGFDFAERVRDTENPKPKEKEVTFIKKCPDSNCRGFLSTAWKCGLCEKYFCSDCHKQKNGRNDEDHECDESEKATVALLKNDTKPCPSCGMPIIRYTGCSQVWTPCCKIAFDWHTLKIDRGRVHSPEYYDYLRRTNIGVVPREVGDDPCGGVIDYFRIPRRLRTTEVAKYHQTMEDINYRMQQLPQQVRTNYDDLGIKYLIDSITKDQWKKTLKMRIKQDEKNNNLYHIYNMYVNVINDLLRNMIESGDIEAFLKHAGNLLEYTNNQIEKLNNRYKSKSKGVFIILREDIVN
jgi:hypothetical protein